MKRMYFLLLSVLCLISSFVSAQPNRSEADKILGIWLTGEKKAKIEIYKYDDEYCGKIVWLKDPFKDDGSPKTDKNNPDEKLQKRPIMGLELLKDFEYDEDLEWEDGEIYDADNGKTYSCIISMEEGNNNLLNVRGYIGFSFIGRTTQWTRSEL